MGDLTVTFTIPGWVWWALIAYYAAGWVVAPATVMLGARYISPRTRGLATLREIRWRLLPVSAVIWPVMVYDVVHSVKRYGWRQ